MANENTELAPWQWPEDHWRRIVNRVRAGRSLRPSAWPGGARCAIALSFDSDHETGELREAGESPSRLSQGQYGNRRAVPRILDVLGMYDVKASFFVPAVVALLYPDEQKRVAAAGHEIGIHGWIHERNAALPLEAERDLQMRSAEVLERVAGVRPVGIRTPSWDFSPNTLAITREMGLIYDSSLMADEDCYELLLDGAVPWDVPASDAFDAALAAGHVLPDPGNDPAAGARWRDLVVRLRCSYRCQGAVLRWVRSAWRAAKTSRAT